MHHDARRIEEFTDAQAIAFRHAPTGELNENSRGSSSGKE
jgi:hypothetical protein